jgi:hypothetical protein
MKSSVYEVIGCMGSQHYREISTHDTKREANAEAKRRNQDRAGMQGKSLREFLDDLNDEAKFFAGKSGFDGQRLQP